jgi:hypothetical protein
LEQVCTFLEEQGALHQWNPITKGFDLNNESDAEGKKINPGNSTEVSQSSHLVSSIFKSGISNKTDDFWILDLGPLLITYALISNVFLILKILKLFPPPFPMETIVTQEL